MNGGDIVSLRSLAPAESVKGHISRINHNKTLKETSMSRSFRRTQLTIILAAMGAATVPALAHAYTAEQQQLCSDDAMRLCSEHVPDVDRITACMQKQYSALSKGCQAVFRTAKSEVGARAKR
jgi:hypothetical protein